MVSFRVVNKDEISYLDEKFPVDIYFFECLTFSSMVLSEGEEGVPFIFLLELSRCFTDGYECMFSFGKSELRLFYSTSTLIFILTA